jgi:hypothetical protein
MENILGTSSSLFIFNLTLQASMPNSISFVSEFSYGINVYF